MLITDHGLCVSHIVGQFYFPSCVTNGYYPLAAVLAIDDDPVTDMGIRRGVRIDM
jgi:hypothetical protein